ncbi:MAG TPA: rod shape-determining protein MreC [Chitinivibrionales bacterium]|nr:rod shape-determining protein MreC [Chitinivibrionales bacterium]
MQWIIRFFATHRNITSLVVVAGVCLWMLSSSVLQQQLISRVLIYSIFYPFHFYIAQTTHIKNIFAENRRLKEEVASLSVKLAQTADRTQENERLTDLLDISRQYPYTLVPARVVARDPSLISRSAIVNVGKDKGLLPYMPVMTTRGVAGKLIKVMGRMSLVQLMADPANRTSVMIRRTREIGILETENGTDFFIMFRAHADVAVGDSVITSGLGGIYPRGLLAGLVARLEQNRDPLFKKAWVKIEANFDRLEEVFVIKMPPRWASFKSELDSLEAAP